MEVAFLNLLEVKEITQKEIDYINELTVKGMTVKGIVERELGKGATPVEVEGKFQEFNTLLKKSNYAFNREKNIYEFKNRINKKSNKKTDEDGLKKEEASKIKSPSVQKKTNKKSEPKNETEVVDLNEVEAPIVQQESNDDNEKDNKKRARQKPTKSNPLAIASPFDIVEIVCKSAGKKEDRVGTGVYVISKIADDFAILENELYYLPGYTLVDVALIMASHNMGMLEKSKVFKRFTEIVREDKVVAKKARNKEDEENKNKQSENNRQDENENNDENNQQGGSNNKGNENKKNRKKQTNIKLCKESTEAINKLSHHFAFLNKSEIINLSMYALSQSAQDSFMKDKDVKNEK